eukprot:TRINITY_DN5962_c0_g1_i1.p1 TRINITY_DN5962_c0_g1~~TRINITY_DN5962_c0_g1_i1.p1  ORF type:complete len:458 (-),score=101.37 TRINITY_DN5962_c0_g1_i1:1011-2384(-)
MAGGSSLSGGSALDEELKRSNVVRLRGLPFSASEKDISDFFKGLELGPDGVVICVNFQGRSTGMAYAQFTSAEQANKALERNRQHIGSRYIEVFKGHPADMQSALNMVGRGGGGSATAVTNGAALLQQTMLGIPGAATNPDMRYTGVIRMRGMPYSCTAADITAFFKGMQIAAEGIFMCTHQDGRPTGEAFVEFVTEDMAARAMQLDRELMGSRYVELFRSTKGEMMTAIQQRMYGGMMMGAGTMYSQSVPAMMQGFQMQQQMNLAAMQAQLNLGVAGVSALPTAAADGSDNTVIKMRGLPFNAGQREIMDFFEGYTIAQNGIHIALGPNERPTGEAYVEFTSTDEATRAMERHRNNIGARYIELFRSSKSEMLMSLGGLAGFGMQQMDPSVLMLLQQQALQQQAAGAYGLSGLMAAQAPSAWGVTDVAQATAAAQAAAASFYQRQQGATGNSGRHG